MENMSIKKATLINSGAKYYNVLCSFAVNLILARILTPEEYGIVAVVTVFITFFNLFSDLGFGIAYIQNKYLDENDRNNLFTFLVYVGIALFAIFFVFAYGIASFYGDDIYVPVAQLLGVNLFLTAVNVIPSADLLKNQKFLTLGIVQAISGTVAAICAVIFAKNGLSYYSIVFQGIINTCLICVTNLILVRPRFVFKIHLESVNKVLGFSMGQIGFNFINYFSRNLDNLLIGKFFGSAELGYYDKAYKTTTYALSNFSSIIGNSIQPVLAKHQDEKEFVYEKFKKVFLFLCVIGSFISVSFYLCSEEIIFVLYGNQWGKSVAAFSYLALSLFIQMPLSTAGSFYQVLNNTKLLAISGAMSAGIIVSGIFGGIIGGSIEAVAFGFFLSECVNFVCTLLLMSKKLFDVSFAEIWFEILKIIAVSVVILFICNAVYSYIQPFNYVISLFIKLLICCSLFFVLSFFAKIERHVLGVVFQNYKRKH